MDIKFFTCSRSNQAFYHSSIIVGITIEFSVKISLSKYTEDRWIKNSSCWCGAGGVKLSASYYKVTSRFASIVIARDNQQERYTNARERWGISRTRFRRVRIFPFLLADSRRKFRHGGGCFRRYFRNGWICVYTAANFISSCTMLDIREAMVTQSLELNNIFNFHVSKYKWIHFCD